MGGYHCEISCEGCASACGFALLPLRTTARGPAPRTEGPDCVDDALFFFRPNVLLRKFDVRGASRRALAEPLSRLPGPADKLLVYLTLFVSACLRKLEACAGAAEGRKALFALAQEPFAIPGDPQWPLGGFFTPPGGKEEAGACRAPRAAGADARAELCRGYLRQAREEVGARLLPLAFAGGGGHNKLWMAFSRRKFMNAAL